MANKRTEQNKESENKSIIEKFSFQDYSIIAEELDILRKATVGLWDIAENTKDAKFKASLYQWFVSSLIPKPIQKTDITSGGHPINTVSFDILENDSNTGEQG
jgi:hypothetical protein